MIYVKRFVVLLIVFLGLGAAWSLLVKKQVSTQKGSISPVPLVVEGKFKDGDCVKHLTAKEPEFLIKAHEGERYKLVSLENGKPTLVIRINPAYGLFSYMDKFYEKVSCRDNMDLSHVREADKERLYQLRILLMKKDLKI